MDFSFDCHDLHTRTPYVTKKELESTVKRYHTHIRPRRKMTLEFNISDNQYLKFRQLTNLKFENNRDLVLKREHKMQLSYLVTYRILRQKRRPDALSMINDEGERNVPLIRPYRR